MLTASEDRDTAERAPEGASPRRRGRDHSPAPDRLARTLVRVLGVAVGAAIAVHAAAGLQIAEGPAPLPLSVDASVVRSGEVGLRAGALLLTGAEVVPGLEGTVHGQLALASETSSPVDVTLQEVGLPSGLEEQIWLRVTLGDAVVFHGTQAELRRTPSTPFRLLPGEVVPIGITVGLPDDGSDEAHGRQTELRLRVVSPAVP